MKFNFYLLVLASVVLSGCTSSTSKEWELVHVKSITGFKAPECAEVNPANGTVLVSNIFAVTRDTIGALDGNGFISRLSDDSKIADFKYLQGTKELAVHGPAGMSFFNGYLYLNDRNNLKRWKLDGSRPIEVIDIPGLENPNDNGCDEDYLYVTSTSQGVIYRVDANGKAEKFFELKGVNGIKSWKGKLFAVTVAKEKSDLYELDPTGKLPPKPFGLAPKFKGLDGLEVLSDGTFLITDCHGHKVYTISPDRKTVKLMVDNLEYPADLGVDFKNNLIYIPQFFRGTVEVYRLKANVQ